MSTKQAKTTQKHLVTTVITPDGGHAIFPPEEAEDYNLDAPDTQEAFDTEQDAMICYAEYRPTTLFLFTADCHIKRRTWTNSTLLQDDASRALSKFLSKGSSIGPTDGNRDLVIGGDLFDNNRPSSQDVLDVGHSIESMARTFYIRGNHDSVKPSYIEALSETEEHRCGVAYCLDPDYYRDQWVAHFHRLSNHAFITGISWMPSDSQFLEALRSVVKQWIEKPRQPEDVLYLVLHCSFKHLLGFDGAYQLDVDMIKHICGNERINILVGHIHTRDTTVYNDVGAYIHSPGSLYPLSSDKMGIPCFGSLIDADTGHIIDVPCDVRKYVTVNINDVVEAGGALLGYLEDRKLGPDDWQCLPTFVDLVIPEDFTLGFALPETDRYVFKVDRRLATRQITVEAGGRVYTIQDAVREEVQNESNREMVLDMAEELLSADDPVATLEEWLKFWQVRRSPC